MEGHTPTKEIKEFEEIMLNVDAIKADRRFKFMSDYFHGFVENSRKSIFHAHIHKNGLITIFEEPMWSYWDTDLIKVSDIKKDGIK